MKPNSLLVPGPSLSTRVGSFLRQGLRPAKAVAFSLAVAAISLGISAQGAEFKVLKSISGYSDGSSPMDALLRTADGTFYGTTRYGINGKGSVFKVTASGVETILHGFAGTDGAEPRAALVDGGDGFLYGTTYLGGANNAGTVFKIATAGGALTTLHSFSESTIDGAYPTTALLKAADGSFYGTTERGGALGSGSIYKISAAGDFVLLYSFTATDAAGKNGDGSLPYSPLVQGRADGNFYGTTFQGGANGDGVVYRVSPSGVFATLHSFKEDGTDGANPQAALVENVAGVFYGTTTAGGDFYSGAAYSITYAGVTTVIHSFGGFGDGYQPYSSLLLSPDGTFYGATQNGGTNSSGVLYNLTAAGAETVLYNFSFANSNIQYPAGAVVFGADGALYGVTRFGGVNDEGAIYRVTGAGVLTSFYAFTEASADGFDFTALTQRTTDGLLYGAASSGGANGAGTLFKLTLEGAFTTLHSFSSTATTSVNADGSYPSGGLTPEANGFLYGTTSDGGTFGSGVLYRLAADGSLFTLRNFKVGNPEGYRPVAKLTLAADGFYYGVTNYGGTFGYGVLYKVDAAGATTPVYNFTSTDYYPTSGLVQGPDGALYGVSRSAGSSGYGVVYRVTLAGAYTLIHEFHSSDGYYPGSGLVKSANGTLYGSTQYGGFNGNGTLYSVSPALAFATLHSFTKTASNGTNKDGAYPSGELTAGNDGNVYGTAQQGGSKGSGTVFKVTPTGVTTSLYDFSEVTDTFNTDGANPETGVFQAADGNFYGSTTNGGASAQGTIFKVVVAPSITSAATASATVGVAFTYQIAATNAPSAYTATGLPPGLAVDAATGLISGTPTTAGVYPVALTATNAYATAKVTLTVTVLPPPPVISSELAVTGHQAVPFTYTIVGSSAPTAYSATGLPEGLTLDAASGVISGTPTLAGTYPVTITATNAGGTGTATLTITIAPPPTVTIVTKGKLPTESSPKVKFLIARSGGDLSTPLTVFFKVRGSAKAGTDRAEVGTSLVIPAGETSAKLKIKLIDDKVIDLAKTVKVRLSESPTGEYIIGGDKKGTFVIADND